MLIKISGNTHAIVKSVEYLSIMSRSWVPSPVTLRPGMVGHACNSSTQDVEVLPELQLGP